MNKITDFFTNLAQKYLPNAYIFSLVLTIFVFFLGMIIEMKSPFQMLEYWGDGFWNLMGFSMQMTLILVCGFTLAKTDFITNGLKKVASLANTNTQAVLLVTLVSSLACFISWGFGLIVSALFAVEVAKKVKKVNFGLLIASSYSGFLVWHGGLSGSIPLKLTSPDKNIEAIIGVSSINLEETLFSHLNIALLITTVLTILILNYLFSLDNSKLLGTFSYSYDDNIEKLPKIETVAQKLEHSKFLNLFISIMGLLYIGIKILKGEQISLNLIIFIFLIFAILFNKTPQRFLDNFSHSVKQSAGIILQFPFYAGIMGMMANSGLAQDMSEFFVRISTKETFLLNTYLSAGLVNFFVPSGGGQWAIQGPIILPAANMLEVSLAKASMAIAWGDAWSNMVQPFWALPLLSIAKIGLKDIMAYLVVIFLVVGIASSVVFTLLA